MRKLFIITSSIRPREGRFTYSPSRSKFTAEERLNQTIFSVNSTKNAFPDADIVLLDTSDDYLEYQILFEHCFQTKYVPVKELSEEVFEIANTHGSKSLCECLILKTYIEKHKKFVLDHDYLLKLSGRYFHYYMNNSLFTLENKDKIFFKKPLKFEWNDSWNYNFVDMRAHNKDNKLYQYSSVLYGYGMSNLDRFMEIYEMMVHIADIPFMYHYDIETLLYFLSRPYTNKIIETDWYVGGWDGVSGQFMYY